MSQESKAPTGKKGRFFIVVYNAHAGRVKGGVFERIRSFFETRRLPYTVVELAYCDWDDVRAKVAAYADVRFIAAGGDGTLRAVFESLWREKLLDDCTVGFVPLGSANIAAFSFRLPLGLTRALRRAVEGKPHAIDLGLINNRYIFFIVAIFGVASNVTVAARRSLKRKFGSVAYVLNIDSLMQRNYRDDTFTIVSHDGEERQETHSHSMIVCNQFNLGGLKPLRGIRPDDGHLHLITLHNATPWGFVKAAYDFFRGKRDTGVLCHKKFTNARYTLKHFKGAVHLDGDTYTNLGDTLEFRVLPGAAKLVM